MILYRAIADQELFFTLIDAATGDPVVGASVAAWIAKDDGAQAAGSGTVDELGNGQYRYNFSILDTDGGTVGLVLLATGSVPLSYSWTTTSPYVQVPPAWGTGTQYISVDQAKAHLNLDFPTTSPMDSVEADLLIKMVQAEAIILNYLKTPSTSPPWWSGDPNAVAVVQAVILYFLGQLYRFRGDDPGAHAWPAWITQTLERYRDPAVA